MSAHDASEDRMPVILLDRIGLSFYQDAQGRKFLPADRYAVRLVTTLEKASEAVGPELESVVAVPRYDEPALADAVRFQASFGGTRPVRLVAVTERILLLAAQLREELGIPGQSVDETLLFRDKIMMKEHLRDRGIRVPEFAPFSVAAAVDLLRTHGRVVAKPRLGAGAVDVTILTTAGEVGGFAESFRDRLEEFEVEQFIDGELFHVDSVVQDAKVVVAVAARYLDPTTSYLTLAPSRDISVPPGQLLDRLLDFNQRVIACYPEFTGVTHHEMFVAGDEIYFCEIGARAGGGGVIAAFLSRTGINLDEAVVQAQLHGTVPTSRPPAEHYTGFVVIYCGPGVLREPVRVPEEPWILEAQILAEPGDLLSAPANCNDAIAIVSVRGDSEQEVLDRLAIVTELVTSAVTTAA